MMPRCSRRHCKNVATTHFNVELKTWNYGNEPVYVCEKHYKEFLKQYGLYEEDE